MTQVAHERNAVILSTPRGAISVEYEFVDSGKVHIFPPKRLPPGVVHVDMTRLHERVEGIVSGRCREYAVPAAWLIISEPRLPPERVPLRTHVLVAIGTGFALIGPALHAVWHLAASFFGLPCL